MIYSIDEFIDKDLFNIATDYLKKGEFLKNTVGEKDFYVQESPTSFDEYVLSKLAVTEGKELENILSFFRVSTDKSERKRNYTEQHFGNMRFMEKIYPLILPTISMMS